VRAVVMAYDPVAAPATSWWHGEARLLEVPLLGAVVPRSPSAVSALLSLVSLCSLFALLSPATAEAQWPGEVTGRVTDEVSGSPVPGATVVVRGGSVEAEADGRGSFHLRGLEPGTVVLEVSALGYERETVEAEVENGRRRRISVTLAPRALPVAGVEARGTRRERGRPGDRGFVLDGDRIRASGASTLGELLEGVPGVTVRSRGPGAAGEISVRGSGADAVLVLVDGVRLNDPVTGEADLSTVSAAGLEEVRVLLGARSVRYGPRAQGGVVVARTAGPAERPGASVGTGSLGLVRGDVEGSTEVGDLRIGAAFEGRARDGAFTFERPGELGGGSDQRTNADLSRFSGRLGLEGGLGEGRLDARLNVERTDRGLPGKSFAPSPAARQRVERIRGNLVWEGGEDGRSLFLSANGFAHQDRSRDPDPPLGPAFDAETDLRGGGVRAEASTALPALPLREVGGGIEVDHLRVRSDGLGARAPDARTDLGFWLRSGVGGGGRLGGLRLDLAGRLDRAGPTAEWHPSHSATLSAEPGPLRVHLAHRSSFSPPSLGDQFFREGVGVRPNPGLRAERVPGEVELGLSGAGALGPLRVGGGGNLHRSDVRDMIVWAPDFRFVWSPRNVDVKRRGAEGWLELRHPTSGLSLEGSVTRVRVFHDREGPETIPVRYRPRTTADLRLGWDGRGRGFSLAARYTGIRYPVPARINGLPGFWELDLTLRHAWRWSRWNVEAEARIDRLLDRKNSFIFAFPEPGRTVELGLRISHEGAQR